jgi:hypothetical protein
MPHRGGDPEHRLRQRDTLRSLAVCREKARETVKEQNSKRIRIARFAIEDIEAGNFDGPKVRRRDLSFMPHREIPLSL